jgi:hypothetical protein
VIPRADNSKYKPRALRSERGVSPDAANRHRALVGAKDELQKIDIIKVSAEVISEAGGKTIRFIRLVDRCT